MPSVPLTDVPTSFTPVNTSGFVAFLTSLSVRFGEEINQLTTPGDNVAQAAVRAKGIDPNTGKLIAPQYGPGLALQGVDVNDTNSLNKFIAQTEQTANDNFDSGTAQNFQDLGGLSFLPFSPVVGGDKVALNPLSNLNPLIILAIVAIVLLILFEVV